MDCVELSDLEEGEILENDSLSSLSESWSDEFGSLKNHYEFISECKNKTFGHKGTGTNVLLSSGRNGYKARSVAKKSKLSDRSGKKSNINTVDLGLEEVSSDGDCLSDNDEKHMCGNMDYKSHKKKKRSQFCRTAEDIMSEIGETISRKKSHCSHRKRKTHHSFNRYKDNYNLWHHKCSHTKVKKLRRGISPNDSNSDEIFTQERKRKKQALYGTEEIIKKPKIRDFDEVRQTLLEKLKKQKEEEAKARVENSTPAEEVENSEIQEVEMGIDSTNYVDNPTVDNQNLNTEANKSDKSKEEDDDDDDLDLIELRLAALESNSKQRTASTGQRKTKNEEQIEGENGRSEDMDLDRYELLLRAEALKTALLKKHQKRLNKAKEMSNETKSSRNNSFLNTFSPLKGESSSDEKPSTSSALNLDVAEKNTRLEVENERDENSWKSSSDEVRVTTATSIMPSLNLKKAKTRRKKRKSDLLQNSAKENTENTDVLEEDDRTLRRQLLNDLLRKKSLKDSDKKSVLMDSVQTSDNQLPVISNEPPEEKGKPVVTAPKKNLLQKVNAVNSTKPVTRIPKPEIKRIIVHLGSEDSSDDNDAEENSTLKENVTTKESNESVQANYEKSVDLLLSQTWQKIEGEIAAARNANDTPEAVYKHLPLSQRLEYIRLKQKIAERERLKKTKVNSGIPTSGPSNQDSTPARKTFLQNSPSVNEATTAPSKSENCKSDVSLQGASVVRKNVPSNSKYVTNVNQVNAKQKTATISKVNVIKNGRKYVLPLNGLNAKQTNQRRSLLQSSQALIMKLKLLLKKIKIEKTTEENYEKEISKLKNQINLFENKKLEQKFKIKKLAEESSKTYKVIQQITSLGKTPKEETVKKTNGGGTEFKSEIVKAEEESKNEDVVKAEEESKSDISKGETDKELNKSENVSLPNAGFLEYNSPLQAFNTVSDNTNRVDPNVMVCQFDLMGVCKDKECTYQHLRNSQSLQCLPIAVKSVREELNVSK